MIGVLPALSIVYVRRFVKEPPVWVENRRLQRTEHREVRVPLVKIFKRGLLYNTLTACWWMASAFVVGYSIGGMFPTYLQKDLQLSPALVALPVMLQSIVFFLSGSFRGMVSDRIGRRIAIIIPALLTIPITPLYLMTGEYTMIVAFFTVQGAFGGGVMHVPGLSRREVPDRGARNCQRLRLSPRRDLWWPDGSGHHLFCPQLASGVRRPDGGRHYSRLHQRRLGGIRRPGNSRQAARRRALSRLIEGWLRAADAARLVPDYDAGCTAKTK